MNIVDQVEAKITEAWGDRKTMTITETDFTVTLDEAIQQGTFLIGNMQLEEFNLTEEQEVEVYVSEIMNALE